MTEVSNEKYFTWENMERQRYGIMAMLLITVGCAGGIAVGLGALSQVFSLILLALTTMTALSMMLALAPMKAIIYSSAVAIIVDILIITVNAVI